MLAIFLVYFASHSGPSKALGPYLLNRPNLPVYIFAETDKSELSRAVQKAEAEE